MEGLRDGLSSLGSGIAWAGLWIGIGLANFGESNITHNISLEGEQIKSLFAWSVDVANELIEENKLKDEVAQ